MVKKIKTLPHRMDRAFVGVLGETAEHYREVLAGTMISDRERGLDKCPEEVLLS